MIEALTTEPTGEIHEAANVFPMLPEDELADLAADIKANGLIHPIVLDEDGALIDGRNRLAACRMAGVDPTFTSLNGADPVAYILSANVARRNLTKGQRAMAVVMLDVSSGNTMRSLGSDHDVSATSIAKAATIKAYASDLCNTVMAGTTSLNDAYTEAKQRREATEGREERARHAERDIAMIRAAAPDLADLVAEERMPLREAIAAYREREQREEADRRDLTLHFSGVIMELYGIMVRTPEVIVDGWVEGIVQQRKIPALSHLWTPEGLRDLAQSLAAVADAMEQRGRTELR